MALTIVKKPQAVATFTVDHSHEGKLVTQQHHQEDVGAMTQLDGPHAMIECSTSMTINLGKFNSVKVACGITLPATLNELDDVFEYGRAWMNQKMEQLVADVSPDTPSND